MSLHLKRTVLFFCVFYLGLSGCLGNLAMAKDWKISIPGVHNKADVNALKRKVNGVVLPDGYVPGSGDNGINAVGIYADDKLLTVTGPTGFYEAQILSGVAYTLIAKKYGYYFIPDKIEIPANGDDYFMRDFVGYTTPVPVIQISPKGTTYSSTPTYKWVADEVADKYCLMVNDSTGGLKFGNCYTDSEANCASGTCSVTPITSLADGNATWMIQACIEEKCGQFYSMGFIVSAGLPGAATLISPSGTISSSTPTYRWIPVPNATSYKLQVKDSIGGVKIDKEYTDSQANCASGTCSVTPTTSLANGSATWSIVACNKYYGDTGGCGPSSDAMGFVIATPPPKTISLSGTVIWGNAWCSGNPLPTVTVEVYDRDGNLISSVATGVDGKFVFTLPFNWSGWFIPHSLGFDFDPPKVTYYVVQADIIQNLWIYSKKPDGC